MSFLISLLLFLGVISSEAEYDPTLENQYETEYATQENVDAFYRQGEPEDIDNM